LLNLGFTKSLSEFTLYLRKVNDDLLVVSLYMDDLLVIGNNMKLIDMFKREMKDVFELWKRCHSFSTWRLNKSIMKSSYVNINMPKRF
jgi:hypothetical protein